MCNMCCDRSDHSVLGVDKTFNLGEVFVTATAYKQQSVVKKASHEHPVVFGPILIHGSSTFPIYREFFSNIASMLTPEQQSKLIVGADDEKALTNAIKHAIPLCTQVTCTRHLKNNTDDFFKE